MERGEQYVQNPLDAINTTITEDNFRGRKVCGKCQQDSDHINECELLNKCAKYGGDDPVYARS